MTFNCIRTDWNYYKSKYLFKLFTINGVPFGLLCRKAASQFVGTIIANQLIFLID